ncbi:putative lipoprotein [Yersinia pestis]|nr:putative lipoprotein [Yersinia pestis]AJK06233.1 putative lipoprotein [Yersinia pestis]
MKLLKKISLLLAVAVLAGCVTAPKPIYNWDNYQSTIYEYYKSNETPEQQIAALKENIEKSQAKGLPVPWLARASGDAVCQHRSSGISHG